MRSPRDRIGTGCGCFQTSNAMLLCAVASLGVVASPAVSWCAQGVEAPARNEAIELHPESVITGTLEALDLLNAAVVARDRGDLTDARMRLERAATLVEALRQSLRPEGRPSYFASKRALYDVYIDVLMRLHDREPDAGHAARALWASERARDRLLIERFAEARSNLREGADPDLLAREHALRMRINAATDRHMLRGSGGQPGDDEAEVVDRLFREHRLVRRLMRASNPAYREPIVPAPANAQEIQQLLDADAVLLEYWLGEERTVVWAVGRDTVEAASLAPRSRIQALARRVHAALRHHGTKNGTARAAVLDLSDAILTPIAHRLQVPRVLIVPDDILQNVPFSALAMPADAKGRRPALLDDHEVVGLPSATAAAVIRAAAPNKGATPGKSVAVIADPVFSKGDPRLGVERRTTADADRSAAVLSRDAIERAARDLGVMDRGSALPRLPFSRAEADAIVNSARGLATRKLVGFDANLAAVTGGGLADFDIVHFATHGLLHPLYPLFSGIVLSLVDERGRPQEGFLRLHDVYSIGLPVELVVVSACHSGFGEPGDFYGMIGMTRGFMFGGARRVIGTLWKIDDEAAAVLMEHFYRRLLSEERTTAAAALRSAQLALRRDPRWSDPYFWAAFVLEGDWR